MKNVRADRFIATSDGLTPQTFQGTSSKADIALYTSSPQQEFSPEKEIATPELVQPAKMQDLGIGF